MWWLFLLPVAQAACSPSRPCPRIETNASIELFIDPPVLTLNAKTTPVLTVSVLSRDLLAANESWHIGLYSPASADPLVRCWNLFQPMLNFSSLQFHVIRQGRDLVARLFRGSPAAPVFVAASPVVTWRDPEVATQVHLAVDNSSHYAVTWRTDVEQAPSSQHVWYREFAGDGTEVRSTAATTPACRTYRPGDMCTDDGDASAWGFVDPGWLCTARFGAFDAATKWVHYGIGNTTDSFSVYVGGTEPAAVTRDLVFGDLGWGPLADSSRVGGFGWAGNPGPPQTMASLSRLVARDPSLYVWHIGDLSYANGYETVWDIFMTQIEPVASRVPWLTVAGNHEVAWHTRTAFWSKDCGGECGVPYYMRFPGPRWYSMIRPYVHWILISTDDDISRGSPQQNWLTRELSAVNRTRSPWLIVAGHRALYTQPVDAIGSKLHGYLAQILGDYRVDLAIWGHHHVYQRSRPELTNNVTHITIGSAGAGLDGPDSCSPVPWLAHCDREHHGIVQVEADGGSLRASFLASVDGADQELDHVVLTRDTPRRPLDTSGGSTTTTVGEIIMAGVFVQGLLQVLRVI